MGTPPSSPRDARVQSAPDGCARPGSRSARVWRPMTRSRCDRPARCPAIGRRSATQDGRRGRPPARRRDDARAAIEAAGIDLDPVAARPPPPRRRRPSRATTPTPTSIPRPGEPPVIGIVGAGAVGTALGVALTAGRLAGPRGRQPRRRAGASGSARWSTCSRAFADAAAAPRRGRADHPGRPRRRRSRRSPGRSGCTAARRWSTPAARSAPRSSRRRMAAGTQIGAFHPLVAFADTERAVAALHGATVAIEGDDQLAALLAEMAEAIGAHAGPARTRARRRPTTPRRSSRPAGSSRCSTRSPSWAGWPGSTRPGSLAIYGPLIEGTLGNARALGIRAALTGPMTRGDVGTLEAHLADAARAMRPASLALYVAAARARDRSRRGPWRAGTGGRGEPCANARCGLATPA